MRKETLSDQRFQKLVRITSTLLSIDPAYRIPSYLYTWLLALMWRKKVFFRCHFIVKFLNFIVWYLSCVLMVRCHIFEKLSATYLSSFLFSTKAVSAVTRHLLLKHTDLNHYLNNQSRVSETYLKHKRLRSGELLSNNRRAVGSSS